MADPWTAPPERCRGFRLGCLPIAWLTMTVALVAGVAFAMLYEGKENVDRALDQQRQARGFGAEVDKAFEEPADTATVSPAPDGSRLFESPPLDGRDGFRLRLPRGWEGRHVGARESSSRYLAAVLTYPSADLTLVVDRVGFARTGTAASLRRMRTEYAQRGVPLRLANAFEPASVGGAEKAYRVGATAEGVGAYVVAFDHEGETFHVLVVHGAADADAYVRELVQPVLDSWRWG